MNKGPKGLLFYPNARSLNFKHLVLHLFTYYLLALWFKTITNAHNEKYETYS